MAGVQEFLKRKNIEFSVKRYFIDALGAMATGLFSSLIIGLIIKTAGEEFTKLLGTNMICSFLIEIGTLAMSLMGAAIGVAVCTGLKGIGSVIFCGVITGMAGANFGGPAGAFVAAVVGCEFGKLVYKETKLDIIVTPAVSLIMGIGAAKLVGPAVSACMFGLGEVIMKATVLHPIPMGIIVSVIMGLVLTAPISSAALAIMLNLSGIAGGAATAGCCAQMIGFAVTSYKDNKVPGLVAQGIGTSMLQVGNIVRNPYILIPPTLASAITGPIASALFGMENIPAGSGMGTSGLVGQIGTFTAMGFNARTFLLVIVVQVVLPAVLSYLFYLWLKSANKIKDGDMKLDL